MMGVTMPLAASMLLLLTITSCVLPVDAPNSPAGTTTSFILIRHAERDEGLDPPLNEEGLKRAVALDSVLMENGVTAIYCTDLIRNRETVEPLAETLGLSLNLVNPLRYANTTQAAAELVEEILRDHAGGTILFCGNRGSTVGTPGITEEIYRRLGGVGDPPDRYRDMYIAVVPDEGATRFIKLHYGARSSLD